jgi:hypothetical protein
MFIGQFMKYTNYIGVFAAVSIIAICFAPWAYIISINTTLTGIDTGKTNYGSPGLMNIVMSAASIIFFLVPAIWAKRVNLFVGAFNLAWAFRNFLLITQCQLGECPEKKWGMYALLILSVLLLVMCLFPNVTLKKEEEQL